MYLVYELQIGPRKKYQSRSRSRRAYSARSSVEEGGGVRRKYRDDISRARERMRGWVVFVWRDKAMTAMVA